MAASMGMCLNARDVADCTTNEGICVRFIDNLRGKGVFANRDFKSNDPLFTENPLVCAQFLWNEFYRYTACEFCMRSMETAQDMARRLSANPSLVLPHPECCTLQREKHTACPQCQKFADKKQPNQFLVMTAKTHPRIMQVCLPSPEGHKLTQGLKQQLAKVPYCSTECRNQAAAQYHQVLCVGQSPPDPEHPLVVLQETWKNMHYPPETASITIINKMIATVKQAQKKEHVLSAFNQFCQKAKNEEQELAHKLLGSQFQEQIDTLQGMLAGALYEDCISQWFTPEGLRSLIALIGMNGQGVGTSSLSVYVHNCDALDLPGDERQALDSFIDQLYVDIERESGTFLNCEGSALYQLQSCCNHSCEPNAEIQFNDNNSTLTAVALRDITEEEEICICYLDECSRERSRHSRQKILRENYLFHCSCVKCLEQCDDADQTSSDEEEEEEDEETQDAVTEDGTVMDT